VTLTGAGGAGKTRLALAVAGELLGEYSQGVWLVELASLTDPALVVQAVAQTLALREETGQPLLDTLLAHLKQKKLLLVLDNCEHLVAACAELATALLRVCPHLRMLATSREGLGVAGERLYRVPSLAVPPLDHLPAPEELGQYAAVVLFVARAQERRADFALTAQNARAVAAVCARLDGMPLAIELAAARVGSLPVGAIAARLDDRFRMLTGGPRTAVPRQQTLRATLDWSYDLLSEGEQRLLDRLSVFAGGWTLEAAEAVCAGEGIEDWEVLDLLGGLVDKSLVLLEEGGPDEERGRYRLLETVRQYGWERLGASGEEATRVRDRHLAWCVALVEEAEPELTGPEQVRWFDRLEAEHDNLRAALDWSVGEGSAGQGLQLAGALWRFWQMRGHLSEGRRWLGETLARSHTAAVPANIRACAFNAAGNLAWEQGDPASAMVLHEECLALRRELGDTRSIAGSLNNLGLVANQQGDYGRAMALYEEALVLFRELGDKQGIAVAGGNLGRAAVRQGGDLGRAAALHKEALELCRELGNTEGIAMALGDLGRVVAIQGDLERAAALHEEALGMWRALGGRSGSASSLNLLGRVAYQRGEYGRAAALHEDALALFRVLDDKQGIAASLENLGKVARMQGDLGRAAALHEESLLLSREVGSRWLVAISLESLAWVVAARAQAGLAARLSGAVEALREALGVPLPPEQRAGHGQAMQAMRAALGEEAFAATWAEGRAMALHEAIALALEGAPAT
jgi:predicted ATPase/Tfp pilus assembly protein PilF